MNCDGIYRQVCDYMAAHHHDGLPAASCLYWAAATTKVLRRLGQRCVIQAGSAYWPTHPAGEDPPTGVNAFGYEWDRPSSDELALVLSLGWLPEMHCWAALPDAGEIIDCTVGLQADQCLRTQGRRPLVPYPDYFWGDSDACEQARFIYRADRFAIGLALHLLSGADEPFHMDIQPVFVGDHS